MIKNEIEELIAQVKREIVFYQRAAEEKNFDKDRVEEQLTKYLETLRLLLNMMHKTD